MKKVFDNMQVCAAALLLSTAVFALLLVLSALMP